MDVKFAFINGYLEKYVFVKYLTSYVVKGHEDKALRLKKVLNGLEQATRA